VKYGFVPGDVAGEVVVEEEDHHDVHLTAPALV
jgi:hypothetical protein